MVKSHLVKLMTLKRKMVMIAGHRHKVDTSSLKVIERNMHFNSLMVTVSK